MIFSTLSPLFCIFILYLKSFCFYFLDSMASWFLLLTHSHYGPLGFSISWSFSLCSLRALFLLYFLLKSLIMRICPDIPYSPFTTLCPFMHMPLAKLGRENLLKCVHKCEHQLWWNRQVQLPTLLCNCWAPLEDYWNYLIQISSSVKWA